MYPRIADHCESIIKEFNSIPIERKKLLEQVAAYIQQRRNNNLPVYLVYICTHNSRRSHFGQVWAKVAASYYEIPGVDTFSGGTEATAFNINAIDALKKAGFRIKSETQSVNPVYTVSYSDSEMAVECFSKVFDHPVNPRKDFAAIMTCGEADENCPVVPGADIRLSTPYEDPKVYDNTPLCEAKYEERCRQIATEIFYMFSKAT
jgi:arsenate reductase (thioredoxin)